MTYTVHQVAELSGVTIKTLYHYHKIGLLTPQSVGENGYRYYGEQELERMQQILFYRELEFPLERIRDMLDQMSSRLQCLQEQRALLADRRQRLDHVLQTLEQAIVCAEKGVRMSELTMFQGLNKQQWQEALEKQNQHLQREYGYQLDTAVDPASMNDKAAEAVGFLSAMAQALRDGLPVEDGAVQRLLAGHIAFLQRDLPLDAAAFAAQARFLMTDSFHRSMLEGHQTGLSYYLCYAAEQHAAG